MAFSFPNIRLMKKWKGNDLPSPASRCNLFLIRSAPYKNLHSEIESKMKHENFQITMEGLEVLYMKNLSLR
eukprot:UN19798